MATYKYKAVDGSGRTKSGEINAETEQDVLSILRKNGQLPISIVSGEEKASGFGSQAVFEQKVKSKDLSIFCRQLATMLRSGMPLDRSLATQITQTDNKKLRASLSRVSNEVRKGVPLSKVLREEPKVYPYILVRTVEAGELSGELDTSLARMAEHFDKENKINRRIRGAMVYPIILLCLTVVMFVAMMIFVLPTFSQIFAGAGSELPGLTSFLINVSNSMVTFWYLYLLVIVALVLALRTWKRSRRGKEQYDHLKLNLPILRKPMKSIITARFTRTLSSMLASGITVTDAVAIAGETSNNTVVARNLDNVVEGLRKGEFLSAQLRATGLFPEMMNSMIAIGEETGMLDEMLERTADFYDEEFDAAISKLLSMIEPLMIILMALLVGTVVIAMYLPIFSVYDTIQ